MALQSPSLLVYMLSLLYNSLNQNIRPRYIKSQALTSSVLLSVVAMARLNVVEATHVVARANLRIATSLVELLHNARENDVPVSKLLKRAYSQEFKPFAG